MLECIEVCGGMPLGGVIGLYYHLMKSGGSCDPLLKNSRKRLRFCCKLDIKERKEELYSSLKQYLLKTQEVEIGMAHLATFI